MNGVMPRTARDALIAKGKRLEFFTIAWNTVEGIVAITFGVLAGSISLFGFGIDSFIEVTSGAALLWPMSVDAREEQREKNERMALRIVGICFVALSLYIAYQSLSDVLLHHIPEHSVSGIVSGLCLACRHAPSVPRKTGCRSFLG